MLMTDDIRISTDFIQTIYVNLATLKNYYAEYVRLKIRGELMSKNNPENLRPQDAESFFGLSQEVFKLIILTKLDYDSLIKLQKIKQNKEFEDAYKRILTQKVPEADDVGQYVMFLNMILISEAMGRIFETSQQVMNAVYQKGSA